MAKGICCQNGRINEDNGGNFQKETFELKNSKGEKVEHRYFMMNIKFGTPIVMNKPGFKKPDDLTSDQYVPYEREHYREKLHLADDGCPYIPMLAIHKSLMAAQRFSTLKPPKGFKSWGQLVEKCLIVTDNAKIDCSQIIPWETNVGQEGRMGRRVMVTTVRPMILLPAIAATKLLALDDRLSKEFLDDTCDLAGRIIGFMSATRLGNGRATVRLSSISKSELD